jgi:hypothetical protein
LRLIRRVTLTSKPFMLERLNQNASAPGGGAPPDRLGLRTVTLRQFYANFNRVEPPSKEDLKRQEKLFAVKFDGEAFGDGLLRIDKDDPFGFRWEKQYGEALALTRALLAFGLDPVSVTPQSPPKPDMLVTFSDGSEQNIEVGRILDDDSARRAGSIDYMKYGFNQTFASDESLRTMLVDRHVIVSFPSPPLKASEKDACVSELAAYFKRRRFMMLDEPRDEKFDGECPTLAACSARFVIAKGRGWFFSIQQPRRRADPAIAVEHFEKMLDDKQSKTYESASMPWLCLVIDDPEQAEAEALNAIEASLSSENLGQFARIIVGYERGALTIPPLS